LSSQAIRRQRKPARGGFLFSGLQLPIHRVDAFAHLLAALGISIGMSSRLSLP
jgi:hypothetical protein